MKCYFGHVYNRQHYYKEGRGHFSGREGKPLPYLPEEEILDQLNSGWQLLWSRGTKEKENVTTEEKHYMFQKGKILGLRDRGGKR